MTQNQSSFPAEESGERESLTATGMFRRAFEPQEEEERARKSAATESSASASAGEAPAGQKPGAAAVAGASGPGEFTRLFEGVQSAASGADLPLPTRAPELARPTAQNSAEAGEFTRVFLSRAGGPGTEGRGAESRKAADAGAGVAARGFSSHGASESTSAEGSVTQLFRAPSATTPVRPAAPVRPVNPPPAAQPPFRPGKEERPFSNLKAVGASSNPRITNLLESLSMPEASAREAVASGSGFAPAAARVETGGVTQFIQKLAEEPAPPPAAPAQPVPAGAQSGPGEYTRMVARVEGKPEAAEPSAPPVAIPSRPAAPAIAAVPALPPAPVVAAPALPRPAVPALPETKTKLEAMAPVLLAVNTVLLAAVLLLLVVLLRSR